MVVAKLLKSIFRPIGWPFLRPLRAAIAITMILAVTIASIYGVALRAWSQTVQSLKEGHPVEAREKIKFCLRLWPRDVEVNLLAARLARMTDDFPEAENFLNKCLSIEGGATEPIQIEFLLMRAQSGELDEVAPLLMSFVDKQHVDSQMILETIAITYMRNLQFGPAYATLNRLINVNPMSARARHYQGWVLERMDQPAKAIAEYLAALELNPDLDAVRLRLGEIFLEEKDPLNALTHLTLLLEKDPNRPEAIARVGQCQFLQGDLVSARKHLEKAIISMPEDAPILLCLARVEVAEDHPEEAEKLLRRALAIDSADTESLFVLVSALRMQGRETEAIQQQAEYDRQKDTLERVNKLLQAEAKTPTRNPQSAFEIGSKLLLIKHEKQGMHWMNEALSRDPNHRPTHEFLTDYFSKAGNQEKATFHRRMLAQ